MPRGTRRTIVPGIYSDAIGYEVVVKHQRQRRAIRFPAGTALNVMTGWQTRQRALIDLGLSAPAKVTTFAQDMARYLALLPKGRTHDDAEDLLHHWGRLYGHLARTGLTAPVIHGQLLAWLRDGAAAQTCNHRRRILVTLWKTLDGVEAANPPKACPKLPVPRSEPRRLSWDTIQGILDQMRPSDTKARLEVMAATGISQSMLGRLTPDDVMLTGKAPHILLRPRRKGAGVPARAVPITPAAVRAFKALAARDAWGPFSTSSMLKGFTLAAKKAKVPKGVYPYLLRHAFGTRAYAATRDLRAVSELLQHADIRMTKRYADGAVTETTAAAVRLLKADAGGTRGGTTAKTIRSLSKRRA